MVVLRLANTTILVLQAAWQRPLVLQLVPTTVCGLGLWQRSKRLLLQRMPVL
jgi:hypothetical protein